MNHNILLYIKKQVVQEIQEELYQTGCERGGILGCSRNLNQIDYFYPIPPLYANRYSYTPDIEFANQVISKWAKDHICFSGFIHSHVVYNPEFSEGDLRFAQMILSCFQMPGVWFGLALSLEDQTELYFHWGTQDKQFVKLEKRKYKII